MAGNGGPLKLQLSRRHYFAQILVLATLYAAPALMCIHTASVADPDIWWHLRTGQWIMQHHAVPHTDQFSTFGEGKPWAPYSWLFEVFVLQLFQRLGLAGIVIYTTGMILAITAALHHLIRRLQPDFSVVVLLTFVAAFSLSRLYTPRPWLFSILFFALELDILMHVRKKGGMRELAWLPVLFALWANLHILFVYGLFVLGIALAEAVLARWWTGARTSVKPAWLGGVFIACALATLANPYGWNIYRIAYDLAAQGGVLDKVSEMQAIPFRILADFCLLFLAMAAAGALAWTRRLPPFETALLALAALISFRSQRDLWMMAIAASAILASGLGDNEKDRRPLPAIARPLVAIATGVVLFLGIRAMHMSNAHLSVQLAKDMPVRAVEVVKKRGYAGPLYNDYGWGGYLIWDLRQPVSIDGRSNIYGDKRIDRSLATWNAGPDWASDPDLVSAGLVIGPAKAPLTQLLRMDPRFDLAFEDDVAVVFVARRFREKSGTTSEPRRAGSM
jgi:hypothetical protein